MNENQHKDQPAERHGPGEAAGDGQAAHGYRNEVSWDDGAGRQPYANQGEEEQAPAAQAYEGGNRGAVSGRNQQQLEQVKGNPARAERRVPRGT